MWRTNISPVISWGKAEYTEDAQADLLCEEMKWSVSTCFHVCVNRSTCWDTADAPSCWNLHLSRPLFRAEQGLWLCHCEAVRIIWKAQTHNLPESRSQWGAILISLIGTGGLYGRLIHWLAEILIYLKIWSPFSKSCSGCVLAFGKELESVHHSEHRRQKGRVEKWLWSFAA